MQLQDIRTEEFRRVWPTALAHMLEIEANSQGRAQELLEELKKVLDYMRAAKTEQERLGAQFAFELKDIVHGNLGLLQTMRRHGEETLVAHRKQWGQLTSDFFDQLDTRLYTQLHGRADAIEASTSKAMVALTSTVEMRMAELTQLAGALAKQSADIEAERQKLVRQQAQFDLLDKAPWWRRVWWLVTGLLPKLPIPQVAPKSVAPAARVVQASSKASAAPAKASRARA